ncbi:MAG: hypothetical protein DWP92_11465, partial [Armatimonadetes bacterium]
MPTRKTLIAAALLTTVLMVLGASPAHAAELPPGGTFLDDDLMVEEGYIEAIAAIDVTRGCNPPANDRFCPEKYLTRAQMASIFVRALGLAPTTVGPFKDIEGNIHANDINALAATGITKGCNPPENDDFCPDRAVTRGEMAAFVARGFEVPPSAIDAFADDSDSVFEGDINALAAAGITSGCGSASFCARDPLPRAQMAVFIGRALGLTPMVPPERPPPPYPAVGDGKRIIYSNSQQRVWLIDQDNELVDTYLVSGRLGIPHNGTYSVYSKSVNAWAPYGGITMKHMVRFVRPGTWGNRWAYGFHSIPRYPSGKPMQTEAEMGSFRSGGCVRQPDHKAEALYDWASIG